MVDAAKSPSAQLRPGAGAAWTDRACAGPYGGEGGGGEE